MQNDLSPSALAQLNRLRDEFTEVTEALTDINPTDRVYRSTSGRHLKVRTLTETPAFGLHVWRITASDCGSDGKALPWGEGGHRIAPPHMLTRQVQPGVLISPDMTLRLEFERLKAAAMALQAGALADAAA